LLELLVEPHNAYYPAFKFVGLMEIRGVSFPWSAWTKQTLRQSTTLTSNPEPWHYRDSQWIHNGSPWGSVECL
jgi:hypothetical protein